MAITRDLFLSILALDSYNRGYNSGVFGLSDAVGSELGTAKLVKTPVTNPARDIGFYATAYTWNGETIISYRGTANFGPVLK